ncbi:MAG: thiolase family protein [Thermodesulfobacteriota bacterium]|nr:thiolase family protein [Thermodesulfobacteriota bacterium]
MQTRDVVIVSLARTPFGKFGGTLKDVPVVDLGIMAAKEVLKRANVDEKAVEEVNVGHCASSEAECASVVGRQISLATGIPPEVMTTTIDTACCSSLIAVRLGYQSIQAHRISTALALGVESMSRTPFILPQNLRWGQRLGHITASDGLFELGYKGYNPVSVDAGEVALEYNVDREEQDRWAFRSQQRYAKANEERKFKDEIVPIEVPSRKGPPIVFDTDEQPRPNTTIEKLAKLPTIYGSPTVTPGNAPGLNDGAAGILLMSAEKAKEMGISPLATIISAVGRSTHPRYIATIPGLVIQDALKKADLTIDDVDLIEINEAFAAMPLVSSKVLADGDEKKTEEIREKINVNGGAVAIGHPVGASGARILMTLIYELRRRGGGCGVAAICGGLAQGESMVVRV